MRSFHIQAFKMTRITDVRQWLKILCNSWLLGIWIVSIVPLSVFDNIYQLQTMFMHMIDPNSRLLLWKVLKAHVAPMFRNYQDLLQIFQQKKNPPKTARISMDFLQTHKFTCMHAQWPSISPQYMRNLGTEAHKNYLN